jgi:hypothetical protein
MAHLPLWRSGNARIHKILIPSRVRKIELYTQEGIPFEKMLVAQQVKKFSLFYGTLHTVFR